MRLTIYNFMISITFISALLVGGIFFYFEEKSKIYNLLLKNIKNTLYELVYKIDKNTVYKQDINYEVLEIIIDRSKSLLPIDGYIAIASQNKIIYSSKKDMNEKAINFKLINIKNSEASDLFEKVGFYTTINYQELTKTSHELVLIVGLNSDEVLNLVYGGSLNNIIYALLFLTILIAVYFILTNNYLISPILKLNQDIKINRISRDKIKIFELEKLRDTLHYRFRENEKLEKINLKNYEDVLLTLVKIIESRDSYTAGHSMRVSQYSESIARSMKLDEKEVEKLRKASILHDIGKVQIPDAVLLKPSRLTAQEYEIIKNHVVAGYEILSSLKMYKELPEIIKYHHEKWDGTGYPYGKKGSDTPLLSRIMVVADAFDAMTTNRIYKPRMSVKDAIDELVRSKGTHFDPYVVKHAKIALENAEINHEIDQLPKTALEKGKFAYFYQDALTSLQNKDYLEFYLNSRLNELHTYNFYVFLIKGMSIFNTKHGWGKGDEILKSLANILKNSFENESVFRFNGDDFLVISQKEILIKHNIFDEVLKEDNIITLKIHFVKFPKFTSKNDILDKLSRLY